MIKKQKDDIREEYKERRRLMLPEEKFRRDEAICKAAEGLVSFRYAEYVLLYAATADEIDVSAIAKAAFAKGKKVLFPRCDRKSHTMTYHTVSSLDELTDDGMGGLEPPAENPVYDAENETAGAVTGRAFTTAISPVSPAARSVWCIPITSSPRCRAAALTSPSTSSSRKRASALRKTRERHVPERAELAFRF